MLARVGGGRCSEVAVDFYTTKILEADVTVVHYGALGGRCRVNPMRYMIAKFPRHCVDRERCRVQGWHVGSCL